MHVRGRGTEALFFRLPYLIKTSLLLLATAVYSPPKLQINFNHEIILFSRIWTKICRKALRTRTIRLKKILVKAFSETIRPCLLLLYGFLSRWCLVMSFTKYQPCSLLLILPHLRSIFGCLFVMIFWPDSYVELRKCKFHRIEINLWRIRCLQPVGFGVSARFPPS